MAGNSNQDWLPALTLLYRKLNSNGVVDKLRHNHGPKFDFGRVRISI